ncbi:MAG: hypothetical protein V3S29_04855, partial [bacterium]
METLSAQTHSEPNRRPPFWWRIWKKCAQPPRSGAVQCSVVFLLLVLLVTLVGFVLEGWRVGWREGSRVGDLIKKKIYPWLNPCVIIPPITDSNPLSEQKIGGEN